MPEMAFFSARGAVCLASKEARSDRGELNKQVTDETHSVSRQVPLGSPIQTTACKMAVFSF